MDKLISRTRNRFVVTILSIVVSSIVLSWAMLQIYSSSELAKPAHISEVHQSTENNEAFAVYLKEQNAYEAHFVTLASEIKQQEAERITRALAFTSAVVILVGTIAAIFAGRRLIQPVKHAYESQERFIQDAAHELRNPLAAMAAALQQAPADVRKTPLVKTFARQTKRLIHINEDLLFLERRSTKMIEKINISELLEDVTEELQPLAYKKSIKLVLKTEPAIEKTMSAVDYVRMIKNIIDNAIKYSPENTEVTITQRYRKHMIEIIIKDHGIGIPKSDIASIGERFFRASNTGIIDGTGLGLAIVQKILNVYGGSKTIESTPTKGTTVTLRLPA